MTVSLAQTLEQEREMLLQAAASGLAKPDAHGDKGLEELLSASTRVRQTIDDALRRQAENFGKDDLINLQSALHAALDEKVRLALTVYCERRFRILTEAARRDSLTGLLNRAAFEERLNEEVLRAVRHRRELAVVMFDVDGFKSVNDRFGHQTGDRVLVAVANVLQSSFRQSDPVFRYGGDEFIALCPETPGAAIGNVLQRLENSLQTLRQIVRTDEEGADRLNGVALSWGIASLPAETTRADELVSLADERLYDCKRRHHRQLAAAQ